MKWLDLLFKKPQDELVTRIDRVIKDGSVDDVELAQAIKASGCPSPTQAAAAYAAGGVWGDKGFWLKYAKDFSGTTFQVEKDKNGNSRWVAVTSNRWMDRDGQIILDSAHKEYVAWLDANPTKAPQLWTWHTPGTARKNRADWWDYTNGFLVFSGPLTDEEAAQYDGIKSYDVGVSHGFIAVVTEDRRFITKYRTYEISDLPAQAASNPFTQFDVFGEKDMNTAKREWLVTLFGEEKVSKLEGATAEMEQMLDELGIPSAKELEKQWSEYQESLAEQAVEVTEEQKAAEQASIVDHVLNVLDVNGLQTALSEIASTLKANAAAIAELREEKNALSEEVKALKETEDARVSAFFTPRQPLNWSVKAGDTASAISEDEMTEAEKATVAEVRQDHNWMKGLTPTGY
jgi:hypothetical protein